MNDDYYGRLQDIIEDIEPKIPSKIASLENTCLENVLNDFAEIHSCMLAMIYMLHDEVLRLEERLNRSNPRNSQTL